MHILFISDNFPPEGNAPASRLYEHATRWVQTGHDVTVVTCAPNFPEGKVYEGYTNRWYVKNQLDGINVIRVKTYITSNEGFIKRALDYLSFVPPSIVVGLLQRKVDVVVTTSPQFFTSVAGWIVSIVKRKPFIFELRDLWPASIVAVGAMKKSFTIRLLEKLELFLYRRASRIIAVTNSFKQDLICRGIHGDKIAVVVNGVDLNRYQPSKEKDEEFAKTYDLANKFVVAYVGTHGMAHGLESIVAVAERLKHQTDIVFLFAGAGANRANIEKMVAQKCLPNVRMIPKQSKEMMPRLWSVCDVSLIHLKNNPVFETVIPSKLFESMGMGIPVLMAIPQGEATEIVNATKVGKIVEPENIEKIADAVLHMHDDKNALTDYQSACLAADQQYSRDKQALLMLNEFEITLEHCVKNQKIEDGKSKSQTT
jgi:glycosyltransferase involved in cell wall biosynthesis